MKKVLALVLAVIMVCTMAFAATVTNTPVVAPTGNTPASSDGDTYTPIEPGKTLVVKFGDASINTKDGKFDPAKNTVEVTFGKGAEWVASKGWVEVNNAIDGQTITVGAKKYEYQITLKQDYTKARDTKVCDLSISKITLRADGYDTQTIFEETKDVKCAYAVGYETTDIDVTFNADGELTNPTVFKNGTIYTIKSITDNGKAVNSVSAAKAYTIAGTRQKMTATMDLNVGQKILYIANGVDFATTDKDYTGDNNVVGNSFNQFNTPVKVVLNQGETNAEKVYNVYAKDLTGKITKLAATLDRGVLTFKVPALSTFIVTTDSVTATATETTPGTTTNPGTGANDVVGVAAALAVVALVSGAAISLKK